MIISLIRILLTYSQMICLLQKKLKTNSAVDEALTNHVEVNTIILCLN